MTISKSSSSTWAVQAKLPGPFQSRLNQQAVNLTVDVFCQTTEKTVVSVWYWDGKIDARHTAAVIVDALNGNRDSSTRKLGLPGPFIIELSEVPPSLVYVICQSTDGLVVGVDQWYMDNAVQIGEWIAHALNERQA